MSKKQNILMILESQVDKIIVGVIVLVSLLLLGLYVIGNPYGAKVKINGRVVKANPGEIDRKVSMEAEQLAEELEQPAQSEKYDTYNKTFLSDYTKKRECAIAEIPADIAIPYPSTGGVVVAEERLYAAPAVPPMDKVTMAVLRGAAEVPTAEVTPGTPYESVQTKLEDIDLVTVSGRFDLQRLYSNFQLSFNNPGLKSAWRDTQLAKPVLARIELQRRVKQPDGTFSDWSVVPRAKIDTYKKLLDQLPLRTDQMQLGVAVLMSQYEPEDVQLDILQPASYLFGFSRAEWMPPDYLNETYQILDKEKEQQKKQLSEERRRMREPQQRTPDRGRTLPRTPPPRQTPARPGATRDLYSPTEPKAPPAGAAARKTERTQQDVQKDVQKDTLKPETRLESMREPVLVWVHDDTTQPGQTYEYRVRVGVFNPVAGKNWFREEDASVKDQTVLWSDFSALAEEVEIPKMLHVFPMETLAQKDGDREIEGVKVEVAKYFMGKWQSHEFDVYPGQIIGYPVEEDKEDENQPTAVPMRVSTAGNALDTKIDYTSDMTMVDVVKEFNWDTRPKRTDFYNMLYSEVNGLSQLAVGKSNWPKTVSDAYKAVQDAMEESVQERDRYLMPELPGMPPGMPGMPPGMPGMPPGMPGMPPGMPGMPPY